MNNDAWMQETDANESYFEAQGSVPIMLQQKGK